MKLLVKGDDYGITKSVTYGIIEAFDHGILTSSGMFTNMEIAPWAAQFVKERETCCFGIDFNLVCGPCVSDYREIPHLVDENGRFISSKIRVNDPKWATKEGQNELLPFHEVYKEIASQYQRFVDLCGRAPAYLCGHSIQTGSMEEAYRTISAETGVPFCDDLYKKYNIIDFRDAPIKNDELMNLSTRGKEFHAMEQLNRDPMKLFFDNLEYLKGFEYVALVCHPGFVDNRLIAQRVSDLLQLLSLIAQVYRFPTLAGAGLLCLGGQGLWLGFYAVLGTAGARTAWQSRGVIQTTEINDHVEKTSGYLDACHVFGHTRTNFRLD